VNFSGVIIVYYDKIVCYDKILVNNFTLLHRILSLNES